MILDTNVLIYFFKALPDVRDRLNTWRAEGKRFYYSVLTIVELLAYEKINHSEEQRLLEMCEQYDVVPLTNDIAIKAGRIRRIHNLKLGDSIIAATALNARLPLVTRNVSDFKRIEGLEVIAI